MFWIPIMAIAVVIYGVMFGFDKLQTGASSAAFNSYQTRRKSFAAAHEPDRELDWRASELEKNFQWRREIIHEFMADNDHDWDSFVISHNIAKRIYLARQGKISWIDSCGIRAPMPGSGEYAISPPWKVYELMERYMLRLEETLRENGVETTAVANYGSGYQHSLKYYPVREYVKKFGYAREGYVNFDTEFFWSQCVEDVFPVPDK